MRLISDHQRAYVQAHPLAAWFSLGVGLTGLVYLAFSGFVIESAVSQLLPDWLKMIFAACWTFGGFGSVFGVLRGRGNIEAASMWLLSGGLVVNFLCTVYVFPRAALTAGFFLVPLAIGCAQRAHHVSNNGYGRL